MAAKARLRLVERREPAGGWAALAPEWQALPGGSLQGLPAGARPLDRRVALLHPRRGVAILDLLWEGAAPLAPREAVATVAALRARLAAAGFPQVFSGHLPLLHLALEEAALPGLARRLDMAFSALPPMTLPPGDAWIGPLRRALTTPPDALPSVQPSRGRRWRLAGGMGLALAGVGLAAAMVPMGRPPRPEAGGPLTLLASASVALAGEAGSDADPSPAEGGGHLEAFDRALAALERSYREAAAAPAAEGLEPEPAPAPRDEAPPAVVTAEPPAVVTPMPPPVVRAEPPAVVAPMPPRVVRGEPPAVVTPMPPAVVQAEPPAVVAPMPPPVVRAEPPAVVTPMPPPVVRAEPPAVVTPTPPPVVRAEPPAVVTPMPPPVVRAEPPAVIAPMPRPVVRAEPPAVVAPMPPPVVEAQRAPARPEAPPPPARPAAPLDPRLVAALLDRGQAMMARGDISGARLLFTRAAQAGSAEAALAMARSFDGAVLAGLGARGIRPDPAQAEHWYRRAAELGAAR